MSIYNSPSKTQTIFSPSNYGGLGSDGQITTDYLDANYISFLVAQGNTTLVGTSVLGNITQQGDLSITGDLLVNDVNVITEIGTKQPTINDGDLTIAKTNGLQNALDNKFDDTGRSITGNVEVSGFLIVGTTDIIDEFGTKQDTIEDGDLTIAKTNGLQDALDNKVDDTGGAIDVDVDITGDLVVGTTNIIAEIGTKQDEINNGDLTIAFTDGLQDALDNKYNDTGGTIDENVDITGDLLVNDVNVIAEIGTKQPTINDGDLTIAKTDGLQTALNGKQPTIEDGDLTIAKTDGLQTALNGKQPTIEDGDLTIENTAELQTTLTTLDTDITTINTNNIIYSSNEYGLKAVSNFINRTSLSGN